MSNVDYWNPDYPHRFGMQWCPTLSGVEQIDPSVVLASRLVPKQATVAEGVSVWLAGPDLAFLGHSLVMAVYPDPPIPPGSSEEYAAFPNGGAVAGGPTLVGGASVAAVLNQSLASYVQWATTAGDVSVGFDTVTPMFSAEGATNITDRRVLDVGVRLLYYVAATTVPAEGSPPNSATFVVSCGSGRSVRIPLALNTFDTVEGGFGEIDPSSYPTAGDYRRRVWFPADVSNFNAASSRALHVAVEGQFDTVRVYAATLQVRVCDETRVAVAALAYDSEDPVTPQVPLTLPQWSHVAPLYPTPTINALPSVGWAPPVNEPFLLGVTEAAPATGDAAGSDVYGLPYTTAWLQDLDGGRFGGVRISRDGNGAETAAVEVERAWPIVLTSQDPGARGIAGSQPYSRPQTAKVYGTIEAGLVYPAFAAAPTYEWVRFRARRFGSSGDLGVYFFNPTNPFRVLTVTDFDLLPDLGDGWRDVYIPYAAAPTGGFGAGISVLFRVVGETGTYEDRWEVAAADTGLFVQASGSLSGGRDTYFWEATWAAEGVSNYGFLIANVDSSIYPITADVAVTFANQPTPPTNLTATAADQTVPGVISDALDVEADDLVVPAARLAWDPTVDPLFCAYEVARRDGPEDDWRTVGRIFDPAVGTFTDVESELGALSQWRVRVVTRDRAYSSWSVPAPDYDRYMSGGGVMTDAAVADNQFTSTLDIRVDAAATDWTSTPTRRLFDKGNGTPFPVTLYLTSGQLFFSAGSGISVFAPIPGFVDGTRHWIRVLLDKPRNDYFGTPTTYLYFMHSTDGETWFPWQITAVNPPGTRTMSGPLYVGDDYAESTPWLGRIYEAQFIVDGAMVANPVFADQQLGKTSFTDGVGRFWSFVNGSVREPNMAPIVDADADPDCADPDDPVCGPLMYLTSNRAPDRSLAFPIMGAPDEYTFPEAAQVVAQQLFMRDYPAAFHPLERAGVVFERTLLVNAVQRPAARLDEAFRLLRDFAWEDLPYVCVRDTTGRRWYASIALPSGSARRVPNLYLCTIRVVEVTDRPAIAEARSA